MLDTLRATLYIQNNIDVKIKLSFNYLNYKKYLLLTELEYSK